MKLSHTSKLLLASTLAAVVGTISANAGVVATTGNTIVPTAPSDWEVTLSSGLSLSKGNSDNLAISASILVEKITDAHETRLGVNGSYSETDGLSTSERIYAAAQHNKNLSDRVYLGLLLDGLYDGAASVDYRFGAHPLLGVYAVKTDRMRLAFEAGPSYIFEDVAGIEDSYLALRFGERLTLQINDRSKLWQSVEFVPRADDFNDYYLNAEIGIDTRLTDRLSFRTFARNTYDSTPGAGLDSNDLGLYAGLTYALNHSAETIVGTTTTSSKAKDDWAITLASGVSLSDGNSDTLTAHADMAASRNWGNNEIRLWGGASYGETDGATNTELAYAGAAYNHLLTDRIYVGDRVDFLYNDISNLDYLVTPSIVIGTYLIKNDTTSLAIEAGPGYAFEKQGGVENEYATGFAGQRFSHQCSENVLIWQSVGYTTSLEDTDNYMLSAEVGADMKIGGGWSVRVMAQDLYDNTPAAGAEENDLRVIAGLAYSF